MTDATTARQRSAATKRTRTRAALLEAAATVFAERGWDEARMDDVARIAGVGVATAYNHFPSKSVLLGSVYRPLVAELHQRTEQDILLGETSRSAIDRHIRDLCELVVAHDKLNAGLVAALVDQGVQGDSWAESHERSGASEPEDIRQIVPMARSLAGLIQYGQTRGEIGHHIAPAEVANYHVDALLMRTLRAPSLGATGLAELVLCQLLPGLDRRPNTDEGQP